MVENPSKIHKTLSCPRVLVEINVHDKLWDHIPVTMGSKEPIIVKIFFEKLPKGFCKNCRIIVHSKKNCSPTKHSKNPVQDTTMAELEERKETEAFVEEKMKEISNATYTATSQYLQTHTKSLLTGEGSTSSEIGEKQIQLWKKKNNQSSLQHQASS